MSYSVNGCAVDLFLAMDESVKLSQWLTVDLFLAVDDSVILSQWVCYWQCFWL